MMCIMTGILSRSLGLIYGPEQVLVGLSILGSICKLNLNLIHLLLVLKISTRTKTRS